MNVMLTLNKDDKGFPFPLPQIFIFFLDTAKATTKKTKKLIRIDTATEKEGSSILLLLF